MSMFSDMWQKLFDKKYREQYALSLLKRSVAFQIKTLRKKHCGSQAILAKRAELTQGVVSRAEDQDYGNLTFNTVGRIAAGLDMAFIGKFVPFSELTKFAKELSEDDFLHIPTFEEEKSRPQRSNRHRFRNRRPVLHRSSRGHQSFRGKGKVIQFPVRQNELAGIRRPPQQEEGLGEQYIATGESR